MTVAESVNIGTALTELARRQPARTAIVFVRGGKERSLTFEELDRQSDAAARGLKALGIVRGTRTVLMVRPGPEFFALTFALFKLGAVPVMVDPGIGRANLGRCLDEARPEAFIGIPLAHVGRVLFGWGRSTVRTLVTVGPRLFWGGASYDDLASSQGGFEAEPTAEDDVAAILFTSGSTGVPKGAVYTHGIFSAQVRLLKERFGIAPGETDLPTFPLFALFAPALGMTAVVPEMDFTRPGSVSPGAILGPIARHGATQMFGSPALLDAVSKADAPVLSSLKRVVTAGAPVRPKILERFCRLLPPGCEVFTSYGATEALPVATIGSREILSETAKETAQGKGVCVGRPFPGIELRIARVTDEPIAEWSGGVELPQGSIGEIVVRGPIVTKEYFGRPEATRLAKIRFPDGSLGHRMGDVGWLDDQGRLWMCGRKSQRVESKDGTLFTVACEGVFNAVAGVRRTALVGVRLSDEKLATPVLCVELEPGATGDERMTAALRERGAAFPHTRGILDFLYHPSFPVDIRHNAKIFREKLAVWAADRMRRS